MPLTYQGCARPVCRRIVMQSSDHDVMKAYTLFYHLLGEIGHHPQLKHTRWSFVATNQGQETVILIASIGYTQ